MENCHDDTIRSLTEPTKSMLVQILQVAEGQCYPQTISGDPAPHDSGRIALISAAQQEDIGTGETILPSDTQNSQSQQQVSWSLPTLGASARSKGKGKGVQFDIPISQLPPSSSNASVEPASPVTYLEDCYCINECDNPVGPCPLIMHDSQSYRLDSGYSTNGDNNIFGGFHTGFGGNHFTGNH
jgi:hypothetical protein